MAVAVIIILIIYDLTDLEHLLWLARATRLVYHTNGSHTITQTAEMTGRVSEDENDCQAAEATSQPL